MRRFEFVLALAVFFFFIGGLYFIGTMATERMVDSATDSVVKMMRETNKIKRENVLEVSGTVSAIEFREKEVYTDEPVSREGDGNTYTVKFGSKVSRVCTVTFADGRKKDFASIPPIAIVVGATYTFKYNGLDEIVSAKHIGLD